MLESHVEIGVYDRRPQTSVATIPDQSHKIGPGEHQYALQYSNLQHMIPSWHSMAAQGPLRTPCRLSAIWQGSAAKPAQLDPPAVTPWLRLGQAQ